MSLVPSNCQGFQRTRIKELGYDESNLRRLISMSHCRVECLLTNVVYCLSHQTTDFEFGFFFSASSFQSAHSPPPPHGHSAFHSTHHTLPHAYAAFDVDTNNSEGSEELEDDWLEDTQDAQPVARASKMSATVIHEVGTFPFFYTN